MFQYSNKYMFKGAWNKNVTFGVCLSRSLAQGHRDRASPLLHKHKTIGNRCACAGVSAIVLQLSCMRCAFTGVSVRWWRCIRQGIRASEKELHIRPPCIVSFALSLCKSISFWLQFARALCRIITSVSCRLLGCARILFCCLHRNRGVFCNRRSDRTVPCGCPDGAERIHFLWSVRDFFSLASLSASAGLSLLRRVIYHLVDFDWF